MFDYKEEEEPTPSKKEPEIVVRNRRNIDDDIRDLISDEGEECKGGAGHEEEKKIDVEPGETMLRNI